MERGTRPVGDVPLLQGMRTVHDPLPGLTGPWAGDGLPLPGTRSTALPVHALRAHRRRSEITRLVLLDGALIVLGFVLAYYLRYQYEFWSEVTFFEPLASFIPTIALLVPTTLALLFLKGLYRLPRNAGWLHQIGIILGSVTTAITATIVVTFLYKPIYYSRLIFALAWVAVVVLLALGRLFAVWYRRRRWAQGKDLERVLVVGGSGLGREVMANLQPSVGYQLVGFLHDTGKLATDGAAEPPGPANVRCLGGLAQLALTVARNGIDHVIVALPSWQNHHLPQAVEICHQLGVPFQVVPDFYEISFDRVTIQELRGVPLISLRENVIKGWNYAVKRGLDVLLVALTFPIWAPVSLLIMLVIRLDSPGPIIFRQTRIGRNGRPFEFLKFRTMVLNAEELKEQLMAQNERQGIAFKMKRDPRMTRSGRWLRKTSLDELPQFWNVLRGEMSLVGPRPAVPEEVAQYEPWQRRRLEVMPGITGLWQATGRSNTTFDEMVRLDIYYAEHWSVALDIRIMLLTIPAIVSGHGAY